MNNMSMQQLHTCDVYYCTKLHPRRTYPGIVVVVAFIANRQRTKQWPMLQAIVLFLRHLFRLKPQSVRIIPGTNTYRHVVSFFFFFSWFSPAAVVLHAGDDGGVSCRACDESPRPCSNIVTGKVLSQYLKQLLLF